MTPDEVADRICDSLEARHPGYHWTVEPVPGGVVITFEGVDGPPYHVWGRRMVKALPRWRERQAKARARL